MPDPGHEEHGYASPAYARALAHAGAPRALPGSGGWLLERPTARAGWLDATGPYPLLACRDWGALADDLAACTDLVSVVAVPDPHGEHDAALLQRAFPDHVRPFKEHFVCDLGDEPAGTRHHRYYGRWALRRLEVEESDDPARHAGEFAELYGELVERHGLRGVHAFPRASLAEQLAVPGAVLLRALEHGHAVAAQIWFVRDGIAYSHLAATSRRGYELRAPYALHAEAARLLRDRARVLHLGGGAGHGADSDDGLTTFKAGWSTRTVTACIAGRILDRDRYRELASAGAPGPAAYFPAYRDPGPA